VCLVVKDLSEEGDSDEDLDEDSDGSDTEALIDHLETKFRGILDQKIVETEGFFDHHRFVMSTGSKNLSDVSKDFTSKGEKSGAE